MDPPVPASPPEHPNSVLFRASKLGQQDLVLTLLQQGVKPDNSQYEKTRHTALTIACDQGHEGIAKLLLDHGADPNAKNNSSERSPLSWAAGSGHAAVIRLLISLGAEPNGLEEDGRLTPLAVAAVRGHEDAVWALLDGGGEEIDIDRKGRANGRTVLSHSAEDGQEVIVKRLIERGAEVEQRDSRGKTPLSWAAQRGRTVTARLLLAVGADQDSVDGKYCVFVESPGGRTPLLYAADEGHEDVVSLLLQRGANPDLCDGGNWSPLGKAVVKGHVGVVRVLLEEGGADPGVGQIFGRSLLEFADQVWEPENERRSRYEEIVPLLKKWSRNMEPEPARRFWDGLYGLWR
ncbi:hypothetical protein V496_07691 [Pseudogymnoascus sp. VKM F-4515 (FW-2607)]|nr:hypothetical protein V496_07691 [Pseudogymnoascus sp. VKM F-4515 (FW-2607)]KFY91737.1 hypothetical protein V498_05352 [Pseudogymnoascus sp. VKM F-4517 (FW-2822)]